MPTSRSVSVAVTLGDAAGIGPEVTLKALGRLPSGLRKKVILVGPSAFYEKLARTLKVPFSARCHFPEVFPKKFRLGVSQSPLARAAMRSIEIAADLALRGEVSAMVTAPINKAGLHRAGYTMPGHTEYLARLSGSKRYEMMLVGGKLRVVPVTRHVAIQDVPGLLTRKKIEEAILLTDRELRRLFGVRRPRIVVCGLNPHAGEKGSFGREEIEVIGPAVAAARRRTNAILIGPLSPDALFYEAALGRYDAEICMYHDQGLIPLKMISRGFGVNVTLGLPFVRTSPDHGTAYDIARRYCADAGSMLEAIRLAFTLSRRRSAHVRTRTTG